jgi:cystathionine beta-lyase
MKRADIGSYGYTYVPDSFYRAVSDFWHRRHGVCFDTEDMVFATGIVPAISSLVRKLTTPAEKVVIQTPVFDIFFNSIYNNGRYIYESPLAYDGKKYSVDFCDLEQKLSDPQTTLMILCNPHNPVGKVFTREELGKIGELCEKYGVTVISDEIHCEFTSPKRSYIPFASVNEVCRNISVSCLSVSKSFNLAGLQGACVVAHNKALYNKVRRALNTDEVAEPNTFVIPAFISALTEGEEWLEEMLDYVLENKRIATEYIRKNIPRIKVPESAATYLLWLDTTELGIDSERLCDIIMEKSGLMLSAGVHYGAAGEGFLRMNLGTSRVRVEEGLERLKAAIDAIEK